MGQGEVLEQQKAPLKHVLKSSDFFIQTGAVSTMLDALVYPGLM